MRFKKLKKILTKAIPLWLTIIIVLDSSFVVGVLEYFYLKRNLNNLTELSKTTNDPNQLVQILKQEVIPAKGYKTSLKWKNLGKQLVEIGAIDKKKFEEAFLSDLNSKDQLKYLDGDWNENIEINENNSRFIVDLFWALGLSQKSKILDEGPMKTAGDTANFASTGGWTLGAKNVMEIYSSEDLIKLTDKQQELVRKIAENVYRPCCGNSTAFPDCNHGMAALGYIELAVSKGITEKQIYKDLLAFNSYWFPQTYVEIAAYFNKQGVNWKNVDAKQILSMKYSSSQGANQIKQEVQNVPGFQSGGGGCGA